MSVRQPKPGRGVPFDVDLDEHRRLITDQR